MTPFVSCRFGSTRTGSSSSRSGRTWPQQRWSSIGSILLLVFVVVGIIHQTAPSSLVVVYSVNSFTLTTRNPTRTSSSYLSSSSSRIQRSSSSTQIPVLPPSPPVATRHTVLLVPRNDNDRTTYSSTTKDVLRTWYQRSGPWTVLLCSLTIMMISSFFPIEQAMAASYGSLSTEQKVVAEAWRLVDNSFLDRTFNHQDWFALRQKYVVQTKYKNMEEAQTAIAEMVQTLGDKYTRYLTPSQYQSLVDSATGVLSNGGVGMEITKNSQTNQIYASDLQENSPAAKAGIQINDVFVQVDGQDITETNTPDDVALLLRGPLQSKVGIVMQNHVTHQNVDYILQRQPITITAVQSYAATYNNGNNKVGVIRIKNFSSTTASVVQKALQELQSKHHPSMYLMDLRGNPGGLLPGGVDTASLFLPDNVPVVYVVNKSGIADTQSTLVAGYDTTTPLTILVDHNTASAAEVLTAALQENHRATIIGERTFGKGIVQTIRELSDHNGGIAITVARYETPQHHDINQQGIVVDVATSVDCPKTNAVACLPNTPSSLIFQSPPIETKQ